VQLKFRDFLTRRPANVQLRLILFPMAIRPRRFNMNQLSTEHSTETSMLVLTRHCGQQLVIADNVVLTVVAIDGNKVRLGITAPKSVRVDRQEVHTRRLADGEGTLSPVAAEAPGAR
jgi:carbon storage regulator CsrA